MSRFQKSKDYTLKSLGFVLLFGFISLGAIGGCNNGGGGPCGGFEAECPCVYSEVPANAQCWPEPMTEFMTPLYDTFTSNCMLSQTLSFPDPLIVSMLETAGEGLRSCTIDMASDLPSVCREANKELLTLTQGEFEACQCKLEQYVKELIQLGFTVWDFDENPLKSKDIFCPGA